MNNVLKILGGLFLALLVMGAGIFGYAAIQGQKLDAESKIYVEAALPRVLADMSAANFLSFMDPADRAKMNAGAFDRFASDIRQRLGRFQSYDDLKGDSFQMYSTSGPNITARYLVRCQFEKGAVTATVTVRKAGENWSLMGVHFDLDTLKPLAPTPAPVRAEASPAPSEARNSHTGISRLAASRFAP
jgi:hypothetical protein